MDIAERIESFRLTPDSAWVQSANAWLPNAAAALLVLVIAWHGAGLVWALLPGTPDYDWTQRAPAVVAPIEPTAASKIDFAAIAAAHLFGEADAEPPPVTAVSAPDTRLNLKLRGTIAADDETIAHAIIADSNNKTNVYFVEDAIPGGASLHEVYPDRVILKRGGILETLRLPKQSSGGRSVAPPISRSNPAITGGITASGGDDVGNWSLETFTEVIRPQPFMPNGELKGYRVYPGRDRRAFAALGLRPGDLITAINGEPLTNIQTGMQVFRSLGESSQMSVTVERNGSPMSLSLDTSQFTNAGGASR